MIGLSGVGFDDRRRPRRRPAWRTPVRCRYRTLASIRIAIACRGTWQPARHTCGRRRSRSPAPRPGRRGRPRAALQDRRRVVEVDHRARRALTGLEGALDQLGAGLGQYLDGDVIGDQVFGDDLADEVEVGLAGRREADLDLLVTHLDQQGEHRALASRGHRVDQRLVAVPQVNRAPQRGAVRGTWSGQVWSGSTRMGSISSANGR